MDYYKIGQKIRKYRKAHGFSQEQLAEQIGISVTHMSHIETGSTKLSLPALIDIANALGATTDQILSDNVTSTTPVFLKEIQDILCDCNTQELRAMVETMSLVKRSMRSVNTNKLEN